jgi:hypothetical protein
MENFTFFTGIYTHNFVYKKHVFHGRFKEFSREILTPRDLLFTRRVYNLILM